MDKFIKPKKYTSTANILKFDLQKFASVCKIGDNGYDTIADAIAAATTGQTITMISDTTVSSTIEVSKKITLDLNGKTISSNGITSVIIHITSSLTIKDSSEGGTGKIQNTGDYGIHVTRGGTLTVESGTISADDDAITNYGGTVEITGGTVTGNDVSSDGIIYNIQSYGGTITISGGTFNQDVSSYLASGAEITKNGNNTWTVTSEKTYTKTIDSVEVTLTFDGATSALINATGAGVKYDSENKQFTITSENRTAIYSATLEDDEVKKTLEKAIYTETSEGGAELLVIETGGEIFKFSNTSYEKAADSIKITKQNDETFKISVTADTAFNKKSVTITASTTNYTVELADELNPTLQNITWTPNGTSATLSGAMSEGYKVSDNEIVYIKESDAASLFEISGLAEGAELPALTEDSTSITFNSEKLGNNAIIKGNAGNYAVEVTGNMTGKLFNGTSNADTINVTASNAVIKANSGDDEITVTGENVTVIGGKGDDKITIDDAATGAVISFDEDSGNDIITGYSENTTLQIAGEYDTGESGDSDVTITVGDSTLTLKNAKTTFETYKNIETIYGTGSLADKITADKTTLTADSTFTGEIDMAEYSAEFTKVDASAVSSGVTISGNNLANIINGGKGGDSISGGVGNDKLYGNGGNDILDGGEGNNTLYGGEGSDTFVVGTGNDYIYDYAAGDKIKLDLTGVTSEVQGFNVVLTISDSKTVTIKSAKDDVITFVDEQGTETQRIFYGNLSYETLATGLSYNSSRTQLTANKNFSGAEINLTNYLDKVEKIDASAVTKDLEISGNNNGNSILGGSGADIITGGTGKNSIRGGAGNDSLKGGTGIDILKGEDGNDTLIGGERNNTLTGGAGSDTFVVGSGNDFITDYKVGEDKIQIDNLSGVTSKVQGSDVILTSGDKTVTIKSAKNKEITFVGEDNTRIFFNETYYTPVENLSYDSSKTKLTASKNYTGIIDLSDTTSHKYLDTITKLNAGAVTTALEITGNSKDNSIKGGTAADIINTGNGKNTVRAGNGDDKVTGGDGADKLYGDAGNDSLLGGAGNDTLYGNAGIDTLIGGEGNDVLYGGAGDDVFVYDGKGDDLIADYAAGDKISLTSGSISDYEYDGRNLKFTIGSGTLTIKNGKGKEITINDETKIYTTTANAQTYDLLYDNNFATDEFGLDDITEQKFEVQNIETATSEISQEDKTLITYTDK